VLSAATSLDDLSAEECLDLRCFVVDAASTGSIQRHVIHPCGPPVMIGLVVLAVLVTWLVLSAFTAVGCGAVVRGGIEEDRARGYLSYRP
jgi:hypothetical protein